MSTTDAVTVSTREGRAEAALALAGRVEAALMASDRPLNPSRLGEAVAGADGPPPGAAITQAVDELNTQYERTGRSFRIESVAGGYQIMTLPAYAGVVAALARGRALTKLSPAAMETLAIIAYKQPVLKAGVEAIRGVACGEVIRSLMDRKLVKIVGRAEELGRPMLYGTTKSFLETFGLKNLKDLPKAEELKAK